MRSAAKQRALPALPRTALSAGDTVREALAGILQRPGRTVLTLLGPVLGIGAFVAVMGLTATASGQIAATFTAQSATQVSISDAGTDDGTGRVFSFPSDAEQRIMALNGTRAAGLSWLLPVTNPEITRSLDPREIRTTATVKAISPHYLNAAGARLSSGAGISSFENDHRLRVAVVGEGIARQLGILDSQASASVTIQGVPFTVVGMLASAQRDPGLVNAMMIPAETALQIWGLPSTLTPAQMLIETDLGAANLIAHQAALALRPDVPQSLAVTPPPAASALSGQVNQSLASLFLALAAVVVTIGAIGIANTTLVGVIERTPEIGLRRALGARTRDITRQVLTEASILGLIGGTIGTALGTLAVLMTAVSQSWTLIMEPAFTVAGPLLGAVIGVIAGIYPARSATRVQPVVALRR